MGVSVHGEQFMDDAVIKAVDPAVQHGPPLTFPGFLDDGGMRQIMNLLNDVQFHQSAKSFLL